MAPDPDKALNALRRLGSNKVCGSCDYEERMGFKDVCMKFKIFVCSDCKSAHQAFSHRCKVGRRPAARSLLRVRSPFTLPPSPTTGRPVRHRASP